MSQSYGHRKRLWRPDSRGVGELRRAGHDAAAWCYSERVAQQMLSHHGRSTMEPSPELRDIITGWFEFASKGDTSWMERHVSSQPGVRLVGTDPNEWFEAGDVGDFLKEEAHALGGNVEISIEHVEAFQEGTVGWGVARPVAELPNGKILSPRWMLRGGASGV